MLHRKVAGASASARIAERSVPLRPARAIRATLASLSANSSAVNPFSASSARVELGNGVDTSAGACMEAVTTQYA